MPEEPNTQQRNAMAAALMAHREPLPRLARHNLNPLLLRRVTPEDVVQDTLSAACRKANFLQNNPEVPIYCKLRLLLFQQLTTLERKHLQSQRRDAYKEVPVGAEHEPETVRMGWERFAIDTAGPLTCVAQGDRHALLRQAMASLPEGARQILELRHFDEMPNAACAEALGISPKNASIRYVRTLEQLQRRLLELTEFRR